MLSISMAYNVISCKNNNKKKHLKIKIADFTIQILLPGSEITKNTHKSLHSITICSIFFTGMVSFRCYLVNPYVQPPTCFYTTSKFLTNATIETFQAGHLGRHLATSFGVMYHKKGQTGQGAQRGWAGKT